jgi:hypothetical protein
VIDFPTVITVLSAILSVALAVATAILHQRGRERHEEALKAAEGFTVEEALREGNLRILGTYFFEILGRLPLADYAGDEEARAVVSQAVRNVERFVSSDGATVEPGAEELIQLDARRAESDVASGDVWGGLTRLRRQIEWSLRRAATEAGIPMEQMGPGQLLHRLMRAGAVSSSAVRPLERAIAICNRGVHGQPLSGEEVEEAFDLASEGLQAMGLR